MLPNTSYIPRPDCPKCHTRMGLMRISPRSAGMEKRMFECPKCGHIVEEIAGSHHEAAQAWANSAGLQRPT